MFPSDRSLLWLQKARYRSGLPQGGDICLVGVWVLELTRLQTAIYLWWRK